MIKTLTIAFAMILTIPAAEARHRHHGSCDGIHRCRCGSTQAAHFGFPRIYHTHNLWRAIEWVHAFPRTTAHAGVVMYQHGGGPSGHVSRLVSDPVGCTAMVADDAGRYERNICSRGAMFVDPRG
jgi:hypothetical protein